MNRSPSFKHVYLKIGARKAKVLAAAGLIGLGVAAKVSSDEGLQRAIKFNSTAIGPVIKYRYYDWKTKDWPAEERAALFQKLHETYAPIAYQTMLELKGFNIKLGQLAAGMVGVLPDEYVTAMKPLLSNCPSRDVKDVIKTIEIELGKPFHEVFLSIDPVPLGSASIGQVHKAVLRSGQVVAVKVQHPDAERFFNVDVATSRAFCKVAQPEQVPFFDEVQKQFVFEFDYKLEAENLKEMEKIVNTFEAKDRIVVPKPLFSTRKVLVMTFVEGETLYAKQKKFLQTLSEKEKKTIQELEDEFKDKLEKGNLPKPPSEQLIKAVRGAYTARDLVRNSFATFYNGLFGYWTGAPIKYEWSELPMNAADSLDLLYKFHGHAIFKAGAFSSDPHSGNIMHVKGEKLGLIDMGQVKRMSLENRLKFAKLIIALAHDDLTPQSDEKIAKAWKECGYKSKLDKVEVVADFARMYFDNTSDRLLEKWGGMHKIMENMEKADPLIELPQEFIMAFRNSFLTRSNAMNLGYYSKGSRFERISIAWEPYAQALLDANADKESK